MRKFNNEWYSMYEGAEVQLYIADETKLRTINSRIGTKLDITFARNNKRT